MADVSKEKEFFKKFVPRKLISFARKVIYPEKIYLIEDNLDSLFKTYYQNLAAADLDQKIALKNAEFKVCSKCGADGLILYIFSKIGIVNRTFVEMGVEDGRECNTANLSLNFGWQGMIVDANKEWLESAKRFYQDKLGEGASKVKIVPCFVTAENINKLLSDNGMRGEIDLLSIDIDGNDYWVWKMIEAVNPRLVVAEYNPVFGPDKALTIKYNPDHSYTKENPLYFGASLAALKKLADSKGYILVGCGSWGYDAFFVRKDAAQGKFVELSPEHAFYGGGKNQFEQIKHLGFDYI